MTQMPKRIPAPASATMACDEAFRTIARQCLYRLNEQHRATSEASADALHEMRIALTRLRTSIAFFTPMVNDADRSRISAELKWLNAHLGIVRDLDVAIERLTKSGARPAEIKAWKQERAACQRHLTRALRSQRYRRLVRDISAWIEKGSWSTKSSRTAADRRSRPIDEYSAQKLKRWQKKLVKKSGNLREVGARKRHRVRLINKKLSYAIDATASLLGDGEIAARQAVLKQLRKAQKSLGQLNDAARYRALAGALQNGEATAPDHLLDPKRKKHLLKRAADAYKELARLKPFRKPKHPASDSSRMDAKIARGIDEA